MALSRYDEVKLEMDYRRMTSGKVTKTEMILDYLERHPEGITPMEAFSRFNATRLGSIIFELRHHYGLPITTHRECSKGISYARYTLEEVE